MTTLTRWFTAAILLGSGLCWNLQPATAKDELPNLVKRLNESFDRVQGSSKSYDPLFKAYLELTDPPANIDDSESLIQVWNGMDGWDKVADWAKANTSVTDVMVQTQDRFILGLPYGEENVPSEFREAGLCIRVGIDGNIAAMDYPYFKAIRMLGILGTAQMNRLAEDKKFDEAFDIGMATLRMLRQACDQQMLQEKFFSFQELSEGLQSHRNLMYQYLEQVPADIFRRLGTKEYPFLKPTDNQRLKRMEMPEGDRLVAEAVLDSAFNDDGQPDPEVFASTFSVIQAKDAPLTQFGAAKRWMRIAEVHGSLDASKEKLTDIYDDWWRRWKMRQYNEMMDLPTELSKVNTIRYAAVMMTVTDIQLLFRAREQLITEINGTTISAGLCGYHVEFDSWPNDKEKVYALYAPKRFDFDPYDAGYGRLIYRFLGDQRKAIETAIGRVWITGCVLYAKGRDLRDNMYSEHTFNGENGDLIIWPPVRQLAREEGLVD